MPVLINELELYRTGEALRQAGLSRATYFRWIKMRRVPDTRFKDRNGRRVFTREEVEELRRVAHQLIASPVQMEMPLKTG